MPVYLVTQMTVHDHEAYKAYPVAGRAAVAQYGGRLLAAGMKPEVIEGNWNPQRMAIVEFASREAALAFCNSPEYAKARALRLSAADFNMILVEGAISS